MYHTMLQKNEKNCPFVGAPFCGAPVRLNMLNMPKSASVPGTTRVHSTNGSSIVQHFSTTDGCDLQTRRPRCICYNRHRSTELFIGWVDP